MYSFLWESQCFLEEEAIFSLTMRVLTAEQWYRISIMFQVVPLWRMKSTAFWNWYIASCLRWLNHTFLRLPCKSPNTNERVPRQKRKIIRLFYIETHKETHHNLAIQIVFLNLTGLADFKAFTKWRHRPLLKTMQTHVGDRFYFPIFTWQVPIENSTELRYHALMQACHMKNKSQISTFWKAN